MRALAHPLRMRILTLLTGSAMSAAEVARELGGTQANISYHLRKLFDAGLLDMVEEVPIRGGVAKRYRHRPRGPRPDPTPDRAMLTELTRRSALRAAHGTAADAELWVDPELWQETVDAVRALNDRLHRAARPAHTPGTVRVSTTISLRDGTGGSAWGTSRRPRLTAATTSWANPRRGCGSRCATPCTAGWSSGG
ncbi:ArsR/SmtB family transcription factor [Actinokineospora soli]|uniref:ArsR/SmtB family transcription factor n=1 Tax=Actinokineospora soli TaxID=1048753 RepID=A0ABW2TTK9_9PSEU